MFEPKAFAIAKTAGIVAVALGCMAMLATVVIQTGGAERDEQAAWRAISGPPCKAEPQPSPSWFAGPKPIQTFTFQGVRFVRKHGDAYCSVVREPGFLQARRFTACQFASPGLIGIGREGALSYFTLPFGRTATVRIDASGATCVVGGWLRR